MQFTLKDAFDVDDLFDGIGIDYQGDVGIDVGVEISDDMANNALCVKPFRNLEIKNLPK